MYSLSSSSALVFSFILSIPPSPSTVNSFRASNLVFKLELRIRKSRQKGQPEHIKQELQVGLTDGNQIGSLFAQMSVGGKGDFGSSGE